MWETANPFTVVLCSWAPAGCACWKQCSICTTGGQRLRSSFLADLLRAEVTWINQNCVVFFLSLHSFLNLVVVTTRAVQRRLHFFFPVSSSVLLSEVELNRQIRVLQFYASERDSSFPPTCTITKLIIKPLSLCFITTVLDCGVCFMFKKISRNLMSYCQERSLGVWFFWNLDLLIRKMTFGLPEGW